jgi:AraC-like DNA-binding protein
MALPGIIFFGHFLFFYPYPAIFPYYDSVFQFATLLAFPLYYIYFRLLTVDEKFSFRLHSRFLVIPLLVGMLNAVVVFVTPFSEYKTWLFDRSIQGGFALQWLKYIRLLIVITYLAQVLWSVLGSYRLLRKYSDRAENFYSDVHDGKYNNSRKLNYSFMLLGITAFVITTLGKYSLSSMDILIYIGWPVFSIVLYSMGYMGLRQKAVNPFFDKTENISDRSEDQTSGAQQKLLKKLQVLFKEEKIYLNSQLTIFDVVQALGTNRTYISSVINQHYNQNFSYFVNNFRLQQLKEEYKLHSDYSNEMLAQQCGFGSLSSMKRVVSIHTGMSIAEWKKKTKSGTLSNT